MSDKDLYLQKCKAQLDQWKAEVDKLKAKASKASAEAQLEVNKQVGNIETRIEQGQKKLSELSETTDEAWATLKEGAESAWDSLSSAVSDAAKKFNN